MPTRNGHKSFKYILSYGGGVNTVALMIYLIDTKEPLDEVVFADTGGEVPETYSYMKIARAYLERHKVPFRAVSTRIAGSDLYQTCQRRKVIPSALWRWCTRDFKVRPIHRYYGSLGCHIRQYVGIAYDEIHRMKDSQVTYVTNLYPLVDHKLTRADCIKIIEKAGLPVPEKSGCFFCPFNSSERWGWLRNQHPNLYDKSVILEEHSKHFPSQRLTDQVFRERAKITLRELGEMLCKTGNVPQEYEQSVCSGHCMT